MKIVDRKVSVLPASQSGPQLDAPKPPNPPFDSFVQPDKDDRHDRYDKDDKDDSVIDSCTVSRLRHLHDISTSCTYTHRFEISRSDS
jgi:hypothetical protein